MGNRWQLRVTRPGGKQVPNWEKGVIHISTGSSTPRPRPPTPLYRHLICRGRGGLTTNGIHLNLPLELSNQPGPPHVVRKTKCPAHRCEGLLIPDSIGCYGAHE